jgi:hypothetical protein
MQIRYHKGAMPSETFQYDVVYEAFRQDEEFKQNWCVVDCARNNPKESISQENASIRVVMDLPSTQKLYPTAYTPGFSTLPYTATAKPKAQQDVQGLPAGYSVALEVYILEEARRKLAFQREYRNGQIDPEYQWLDDIIRKHDGEKKNDTQEVANVSNAYHSNHLLPWEDDRARMWEDASSVRQENLLVSPFESDRGKGYLPPRDAGTWSKAAGKSPALLLHERESVDKMESLFDALMKKTCPDEDY